MCGIFASYNQTRVMQMLTSMQHRGPDASAIERLAGFSVGFNRLAIVDRYRAGAAQPRVTKKGNVVVFNGEVYNYKKLWSEAPSEIALLGEMLDEGLDPRQYLDGDYAILYYNPSLKQLTLYRDRFGVCPLYYSITPKCDIEVSSEARRLHKPREVPAHGRVQIDMRTAYAEVSTIPLYGATNDSALDIPEIAEAVMDAVKTRATHTDTGFSLALSGGLDSTVIAYALRNLNLKPESALCTGFSADSDDLECAQVVAEHLGFDFYPIIIKPSPFDQERILDHFDGPVSPMRWRGGLRSWYVAKYSPTRVILCGDGPDELIGGYPCHASLGRAYRTSAKRLSTLRSMQHFNLDRTNKMGMAHSKEFRAPFLASTLSQVLLGVQHQWPKMLFRHLLSYWGCPSIVVNRKDKYSPDELAVAALPEIAS